MCLDSMYSYEKLFLQDSISVLVVVAVSKEKDVSYLIKQRTQTDTV